MGGCIIGGIALPTHGKGPTAIEPPALPEMAWATRSPGAAGGILDEVGAVDRPAVPGRQSNRAAASMQPGATVASRGVLPERGRRPGIILVMQRPPVQRRNGRVPQYMPDRYDEFRFPARVPSFFVARRKKGAWFEVNTGGFLARMALMAGSASNSSATNARTASRFQPRGWAKSR